MDSHPTYNVLDCFSGYGGFGLGLRLAYPDAELLRPDPHEPPVYMLICPCGHSEPAPADIEADQEDRPRMPGF